MKPTVAHIRERFLPLSETFIYQFMKEGQARTRPVAVYVHRDNEAAFPWDDVYPLSYPPSRFSHERLSAAFLRATRIRPYADSIEGVYLSALRRLKPDIVHAHFGRDTVHVTPACQKLGIPLVAAFYGYDFSVLPSEQRWSEGYGRVFRYASRVIVLSSFAAGYLRELNCPADKITVVHSGVDLDQFPFEEPSPASGHRVTFIGVGRLVEKKGTRYALEALAVTRRTHPDISYTHVGGGPLEDELKSLAVELGVDDICDFRGVQPHSTVLQALRDADILLMPSVTAPDGDVESQGVVLQEAQAMGLPVVATWHNGFPEGIAVGESGYLVPERDVKALAERMDYLIANKETWAHMGRRGRAFVEDNFDARRQAAKLEDLYEAVLGSPI